MGDSSVEFLELNIQKLMLHVSFAQTIINAILLIVTLISVICAFGAYRHQKLRSKKDAACSLAKYYANNIIPRINYIVGVFASSGFDEKVHKAFPLEVIKEFNYNEAVTIAKEEKEVLQLATELLNMDPRAIYSEKIRTAKTVDERHTLAKEYTVWKKDESGTKSTVSIIHTDILQDELMTTVQDLLNDLEWFSMNFHYNLADEQLLYQSLHQSFISNVWLLYLYIALCNKPGSGKFYTNTIWLFLLWRDRLRELQSQNLKEQAERTERIKELESQQASLKHECETVKKKNDENLPIYTGKPL